MRQAHAAFISGLIFGLGLCFAGMIKPENIIGFLDIMEWNPTLIFVMAGAILVHAPLYRLVRKRSTPIFDIKFHIPDRRDLTPQLILGGALFGVGWGIGGFCPGPAVTSLVSGDRRVFIFIVCMLIGMWSFNKLGPKIFKN